MMDLFCSRAISAMVLPLSPRFFSSRPLDLHLLVRNAVCCL